MQNEITYLRNQVRTLKRIVCLISCFSLVFVVLGCTNRLTVSEHFDKNVYDSAIVIRTGLGMSDIDAQRLFNKLGYKVHSQNELNYDKKRTLHCSITTGFSEKNLSEYEIEIFSVEAYEYHEKMRRSIPGSHPSSIPASNPESSNHDNKYYRLIDCQVEFNSKSSSIEVYKEDFFNRIYEKLKPILDITKN
jgi:hypothetical protein